MMKLLEVRVGSACMCRGERWHESPKNAGGGDKKGPTSGAPKACKVVSTLRTGSLFRPMRVVSLPSLQVPAPPSPGRGVSV